MKEKVNDALKAALPARVPEPHRRHHRLPRAVQGRGHHDRRPDDQAGHGPARGQGIGLELTEAAKLLLAERGYDPTLGARPLRRAIQRLVEDPLSERLLWKEFRAGEIIIVDAEPDPETGELVIVFNAVEGFEPPPMEMAETGPAE